MTDQSAPPAPTAKKRWDDMDALMAPFRDRVVAIVARLTALGLKPLVWETYRTPERAASLQQKGTGIKDSMHCYGVAADIICAEHKWSCAQHGCDFFPTLGEQSERCGLVWGGRWPRRDLPHVQAIPLARQNAIRAATSHEEREQIVIAGLGPMVP